jgi:hypothetical protein
VNRHVYVGARRRLIKIIAVIHRPSPEVYIRDKAWRVVSRHRLGLPQHTGAVSPRVIHGIIGHEKLNG